MKDEFENRFKIPGQVRLKLWFGHEKEETDWLQPHLNEEKHGALLIYAETVSLALVLKVGTKF